MTGHDLKYMKAALKLSKKGLGFTEPNPLVRAVVVKDNTILATGYHRRYGAPHAEPMALETVNQKDTTLYVTLEPCTHYGKTPPCTDLILGKKVKRVVVALEDPNPRVSGKGIRELEENGVRVDVGLLKHQALKINRHYVTYMTRKRPYVALKAGVSCDGKMTDKNRASQWITDQTLRRYSHGLRGEFSAIMAGVQTVIDDNARLTLRDNAWDSKQLFRVVLDTHNRLDPGLNIFRDQDRFPLVLFSSNAGPSQNPKTDRHFFVAPDETGTGLQLPPVLETLHGLGIASVLVEGGGALWDSFLRRQLYDEIVLFTANTLIGGENSVQLFASGASVSHPVTIGDRHIIPLQTGYILRGFRQTGNRDK
ncbi:MAG: bifunctional diaminohydroxyphosphoribosylaminopyrimidine deaminase/5-amino-6-(5-phosphoribosylamino)uracil reductase RibD [bacterium]|nr:bifunctional diaminohydroxyphosphoribosylaminopyrimidine deaminase/5-amino-6-(5-phosphoribosylamino)uracil reductase RibD [bacterium]